MALNFYVALKSSGIVNISFDPSKNPNDSLAIVSTTSAGVQPGWLASRGNKIYAISRTHFPDEMSKSGGVFAFQKSTNALASLTFLNEISSNGEGGVHCAISPDGTTLAAANITASTVSIYPLLENGEIGNPSNVFKYESDMELQAQGLDAFPHECGYDPTGQFLFVPARNADRVYVYSAQGPDQVLQIQKIVLPSASGPRHTTFRQVSSAKSYMYLLSERDNTIRTYVLDYESHDANGSTQIAKGLSITLLQTISTLGEGLGRSPHDHKYVAAEVAISDDGKFAYASNRGTKSMDSDTIIIYSINEDHTLKYLGMKETGGKTPRNFALSNEGANQWVAVAHEVTQDIVVFERDAASGLIKEEKGRISFGGVDKTRTKGPVCIVWD